MNTFSRFSVLSSEVDVDSGHKQKKSNTQKKREKLEERTPSLKASKALNATPTVARPKKKKPQISDLQALAFGYTKGKTNNKKGNETEGGHIITNGTGSKNKTKFVVEDPSSSDEDPEWLRKDEEYVNTENEKNLQEAINQSRLEFKKLTKKELAKAKKEEEEKAIINKQKEKQTKKKKDKPITISLDEFNNMGDKKLTALRNGHSNESQVPRKGSSSTNSNKSKSINSSHSNSKKDVEKFPKIFLETEKKKKKYQEMMVEANKFNQEIQIQTLVSEIETRDFEIQALHLEVDSVKDKLTAAKSRNKKLCEIISHSEMRSIGELVIELEKASKVRDEYLDEVNRLSTELEQERTKVSQLTTELKKNQVFGIII